MSDIAVFATEYERDAFGDGLDMPKIVTGVGYGNAYRALADVPRDAHIINIGYAGGYGYRIGDRVRVGECRQWHPNAPFDSPSYELDGDAICFTSGDFVTSCDLPYPCVFDMELYAILSMGFHDVESIKIISDNLSLEQFDCNIKIK